MRRVNGAGASSCRMRVRARLPRVAAIARGPAGDDAREAAGRGSAGRAERAVCPRWLLGGKAWRDWSFVSSKPECPVAYLRHLAGILTREGTVSTIIPSLAHPNATRKPTDA